MYFSHLSSLAFSFSLPSSLKLFKLVGNEEIEIPKETIGSDADKVDDAGQNATTLALKRSESNNEATVTKKEWDAVIVEILISKLLL